MGEKGLFPEGALFPSLAQVAVIAAETPQVPDTAVNPPVIPNETMP